MIEGLEDRLRNNEDFLGRGWKFWEDVLEFFVWIIENREYFIFKGIWKY